MFVINNNGHFFQIDQKIDADLKAFRGCRFFDTEKAMLEAVCKDNNLQMDEVEGGTFFISQQDDDLYLIDDRGFKFEIEEPVEAFINDYIV